MNKKENGKDLTAKEKLKLLKSSMDIEESQKSPAMLMYKKYKSIADRGLECNADYLIELATKTGVEKVESCIVKTMSREIAPDKDESIQK